MIWPLLKAFRITGESKALSILANSSLDLGLAFENCGVVMGEWDLPGVFIVFGVCLVRVGAG